MKNKQSQKSVVVRKTISPVLPLYVRCPVCRRGSEQLRLKSQIVVARQRGVDFRPQEYFWSVRDVIKIHPPLIAMWTCPNCHFSAFHEIYPDPLKSCAHCLTRSQKDTQFEGEKEEVRSTLINSLEFPALPVALEKIDHLLAIKQNLAAIIWIRTAKDLMKYDCETLGKYYLRLAWLFEEIEESKELGGKFMIPLLRVIQHLEGIWPTVPRSSMDSRRGALKYLSRSMESRLTTELSPSEEFEQWLLLVRVAIMCKDWEDALKNLSTARREQQRMSAGLEEEIKLIDKRDDEGMTARRNSLRSEIRKIDIAMRETRDIYDQEYQSWEADTIDKALDICRHLNKEEADEKLEKMGLPRPLLSKIKGLLKNNPR